MEKKYNWVFLGTPEISAFFLEKLKNLGLIPTLIITNPDKFIGRKKILTSSPVALWAEKNNIEIIKDLKQAETSLKKIDWDFFFVLAYGKILKTDFLKIPKYGTVNLHPSLLPKYRGPSPIMSAVLDDQKNTGISLMLLDEKMDHGPIILQKKIKFPEWQRNIKIEKTMAENGAELFFENYQNILNGKILPTEQNHQLATYCQKYQKENMELSLPLNSRKNWLKYCAFSKPFFIDKNGKRNIITQADWQDNNFIIKKIIPEGKKERDILEQDLL